MRLQVGEFGYGYDAYVINVTQHMYASLYFLYICEIQAPTS